MTAPPVRLLKTSEMASARALLTQEGWTFTQEELERLQRLGGAVGALVNGRVVAFLTFLDLSPVRWIGNVAVASALRGEGMGKRLVDATLAMPGRVSATGLYSVEKAVTLYERAGFVARGEAFAYRTETAIAQPVNRDLDTMSDVDLPDVFRLDMARSGMDRRALLAELLAAYPDTSCVLRDRGLITGFGIAKTYDDITELGPIVATNPGDGDVILDALLHEAGGPYEATVLGENRAAIAALEARGFERAFRTVPMFRGQPPKWDAATLMLAAGLEKS